MEGRMLLATFAVTNTSPLVGTIGSLPYEITQSNATPATVADPNIIQFDIATSGRQTITLTSALPDITTPSDIQGYTEPGSSPNTNPPTMANNAVLTIIISGGGTVVDGLTFDATAGGAVSGLDLEGFAGTALVIDAGGMTVSGNFIGITPDGMPTAASANVEGVALDGADQVTIGGTSAGAGNIIEANTAGGISIESSDDSQLIDSKVFNNGGTGIAIERSNGTSVANSTISGSTGDGIDVGDTTDDETGESFANDTIFDNSGGGISLSGFTVATISGSTIGANGSFGIGTAALSSVDIAGSTISGNGGIGISIIASIFPNSVTGSTIAENLGGGILIAGASGQSVIASSTIGGTNPVGGNGGFGVSISGSASVSIGGASAGAGILVAENKGVGIAIDSSSDSSVVNSTITGNQGDGIDLYGSTGASLKSNVVASNLGGGVLVANGAAATINVLTDSSNGTFGVSSSNSAIRITFATIIDNGGVGLSILNPTNPFGPDSGLLVFGDVIQSNRGGGLSLVNDSIGGTIGLVAIGGPTPGLGNGGFGLSLVNSSSVIIGDANPADHVLVQYNGGVGISLASSFGEQVEGANFVADNAGDGIALNDTGVVVIEGTTVLANSGSGVSMADMSNTNTLVLDTISGNSGAGVAASGSQNLTFGGEPSLGLGLSIFGNRGPGIALSSVVDARVIGDVVRGNRGGGVSLDGVTGTSLVSSSTIGGTGPGQGNGLFGVSVAGSPGVFLVNLVVLSNVGDGIAVASGSASVSLINPLVFFNDGDGIAVSSGSAGVSIAGGQVSGNANSGVVVSNSSSPAIGSPGSGLVITGNQADGVDLIDAPGGIVDHAVIGSNGGFGVRLLDSPRDSIGAPGAGNVIEFNAASGVGIVGASSTNDVVQSNFIASNLADGVSIEGGAAGNFVGAFVAGSGNILFDNHGDGASIVDSSGNRVIGGNRIAYNRQSGVRIAGGASNQVSGNSIIGNAAG